MALNFWKNILLSEWPIYLFTLPETGQGSLFQLLIPIPGSQRGLMTILWMNNMLHLLKHCHWWPLWCPADGIAEKKKIIWSCMLKWVMIPYVAMCDVRLNNSTSNQVWFTLEAVTLTKYRGNIWLVPYLSKTAKPFFQKQIRSGHAFLLLASFPLGHIILWWMKERLCVKRHIHLRSPLCFLGISGLCSLRC